MPEYSYWESLFEVDLILEEMQINASISNLLEIGGGYGTFTIPAAKLISGKIFAFDIDDEMIAFLQKRIVSERINNIVVRKNDILEDDVEILPNSMDYVMLFNIMHHDKPKEFLEKAHGFLMKGGKVGIIHWRSDIETPRGPDLSIRPKTEDILALLDNNQFTTSKQVILNPYHYGLILTKI